jgi:putative membrane protein
MLHGMTQRRLTLTLLALVLAAPAAAQKFVDPLRRALPAAEYTRRAAANDLYEREAAQMILRSSHNPEVRKLAQTLLADHGRITADLRGAAAKSAIKIVAAGTTVEFKQLIGKLTLATAENRDLLFLTQQHAVHQRSLAMHQDYAEGGDQPALKEAAARIAAIEQAHLDAIDAIKLPPVLQPVALQP